MKRVIPTLALACLFAAPRALHAQAGDRALDIGPNRTGLSIGDSREWTGVRLNYRDSRLRRVRGVNATIWRPYDGGHGDVMGLALGVPLTGGRNVQGIQVAAGIEATDELGGVGVAAAQDADSAADGGDHGRRGLLPLGEDQEQGAVPAVQVGVAVG
ncbi:MAG TPA: hypothetical protein PKC83_17385, partial [Gemmatimonadaceae bacterium]|nr:hypothetical protein [Gemmatimonadaceae bacterium]